LASRLLSFTDPDGMSLALVGVAAQSSERRGERGAIPVEHAIRDFPGSARQSRTGPDALRGLSFLNPKTPCQDRAGGRCFSSIRVTPGKSTDRMFNGMPPSLHAGSLDAPATPTRGEAHASGW